MSGPLRAPSADSANPIGMESRSRGLSPVTGQWLRYATLIFDCDGVILNSNRVKTEAFRWAASPYGSDAAEALVEYHLAHGGVSRYRKFAHFLAEIVPDRQVGPGLNELLARYSKAAWEGLMSCEVAPGLRELRAATPDASWMIVSGGDQAELRRLFARRDLGDLFNGGIFGSPERKETILAREMAAGSVRMPALLLGDSQYDHEVAAMAGCDFLFVSGWSEFAGWQSYVMKHGLSHVPSISSLNEHSGARGT